MTQEQSRSRVVAVVFTVMITVRTAGVGFAPALFAFAPLALLVVSPFVPNLVMAAPEVSATVFFATLLFVQIPSCVIAYVFGLQYGPLASEWIVEKTPIGRERLDWLLRGMRYSAPPILMALPGPLSSVVAGVAKVPRTLYGVVMVPTQVAWFVGSYFLGEALVEAIRTARGFVADHVLVLTGLTLLLVAVRWLPSRTREETD